MVKTDTIENTIISPYSKIKVYWADRPENYSKEAKTKIRNYFSGKYGVMKNNISVIYQPVKYDKNGNAIEITGAGIENIMDVNYQRALMKEVIARDGKEVDLNRIYLLDDKVNAELNIDLSVSQHKSWSIKWVMIDNFLSFGEKNYITFSKLKGLTIVNSIPSNQGGKTTLTIDVFKFLLHGTTTKTDKNELVVRGMIDIEGDEIIIERKMRRTPKKTGEWTVVNKVNYYTLLPDGSEEEQNEEDAKKTTLKLKETIGSEKDFEMLVLATEKNLDDLIGLTTTESGKVLSRLIGLEILEIKERIVRDMYNKFDKKKKSNEYNVVTLNNDIVEHNAKILEGEDLDKTLKQRLIDIKKIISDLNNENDALINNKERIDVEISSLNPSKLQEDVNTLTLKGKSIKEKISELDVKIKEIGIIKFDEDEHHELTKLLSSLQTEKAINEAEINRLKKVIIELVSGGICQSCNRKLDDVDNSEHIKKHEDEIIRINHLLLKNNDEIQAINVKLEKSNNIKNQVDVKNRLELDKDRLDVEVGSLRNLTVAKMNDLKKYNLNLEAIEHNKKIEIMVSKVKTDIIVNERVKEDIVTNIERVSSNINNNKKEIETKVALIEVIKKEEEVEKIFKIYIDLVGKKGISKLVLRSVLPIINSEVQRLLDDVCDFEVEIFMDDKNDVKFLINKDDITKSLKSGSGFEKTASSLALRAILGKISTLPMPNFITFDEVLGKVAPENIEKLKGLFEKIKDMYDIVFLITHNDLVKDWSENLITVTKKDNISSLVIK
jgi:DNA repair exonuclease SbcCD ATPase subunit